MAEDNHDSQGRLTKLVADSTCDPLSVSEHDAREKQTARIRKTATALFKNAHPLRRLNGTLQTYLIYFNTLLYEFQSIFINLSE